MFRCSDTTVVTFVTSFLKIENYFFSIDSIFALLVFSFQGAYLTLLNQASGDKEIRTPDPLLARQVLSQLSYTPRFTQKMGSSGLEPPTSRLSGVRSNHLSYEPVLRVLEPSKLNNALKVSLTLE